MNTVSGVVIQRESVSGEARRWEQPDLVAPAAPLRTVRQLEALEEEARAEGYAKGLAEGRAQAAEELGHRVAEVEALLDALARPLQDLDAEVEHQLVELAMAVARQLVRRELRSRPDEVIGVVRQALSALPASARHVRVHLHPEDAALVKSALKPGEGGHEHAWEIREDAMLTRGGCLVNAESSQVDARVETRLGAVIAAIMGGARDDDAATDDRGGRSGPDAEGSA